MEGRSLCHVSGITAALSDTANDLLQRLVIDRTVPDVLVSFDVNYRPALWPRAAAPARLLQLARGADIVFVGRDEAQVLWGTEQAAYCFRMLHIWWSKTKASGRPISPAIMPRISRRCGRTSSNLWGPVTLSRPDSSRDSSADSTFRGPCGWAT
jgi:hypothetical protein